MRTLSLSLFLLVLLQFPALGADLKRAGVNLALCKANLSTVTLLGRLARRSCDRAWLKTVNPDISKETSRER